MATYKERWIHAIGNEPELHNFLKQYQAGLKNEMRLLLSSGHDTEMRENSIINQTIAIEKEVLSAIGQLENNVREEEPLRSRLLSVENKIEINADERKEAIASGNHVLAMSLIKESNELFKEREVLHNQLAKRGGIKLTLGHAKHLEKKVRELFKHYLGLFSFLEYSIHQIDINFGKESKKIVQLERAEQEFIRNAESKLIIDSLRKLKDNRLLHLKLHKDVIELLNHMKKLKDIIETRLNVIEQEFFKFIEWLEKENKWTENLKIKTTERSIKFAKGRDFSREFIDEMSRRRYERKILLQYSIFLKSVYNVLKGDEHLIAKNRDSVMHILQNAYYQLARQGKLAA